MRRALTRKQKGRGCGCGGMEMLGFPKTGGFMGLFGGQEEPMGTLPTIGQDSSVMMKNPEQMMKEALPQEIVSNSAPRKPQRQERPRDMMRSSGSSIRTEIKMMKNDIQTLQRQVSELQYNNYSSGNTSPGLFGGRRKTLRRMRKHRR
jgi:hypothetical protein